MKIGIVGTGAVGGYFGGQLRLAGHDVVFLARGKTLETLKTQGLTLETKEKTSIIKGAIFTDDPSRLRGCQFIFITVKSYDTESTAKKIKPYLAKDVMIITQQNGINNDLILSEILGKDRVIPAITKGGYDSPTAGHFRNLSFAAIEVDEYDGQSSPRLKKFAGIFKNTDIEVIISAKIQIQRWKKYILNCTFNIVSAVTRLRVDQMLNNIQIYDLCIQTIKEIILVAKKEGIILDETETVKEIIISTKKLGAFKTSTLQDIENRKPIEIEAFTGYILKLARKHNLKVPINETLYALLSGIIGKKINY